MHPLPGLAGTRQESWTDLELPSEPHENRAKSRWSEIFCQKITESNSKGTTFFLRLRSEKVPWGPMKIQGLLNIDKSFFMFGDKRLTRCIQRPVACCVATPINRPVCATGRGAGRFHPGHRMPQHPPYFRLARQPTMRFDRPRRNHLRRI